MTYDVLMANKNIPKAYHVSGYPTLYLLDSQGKVTFSLSDFGEGMEEHLEMIIKKALYE